MNTIFQSGLYRYPCPQEIHSKSPLHDKNVYFIKPYEPGLTIRASLGSGVDVKLTVADWKGNIVKELGEQHMNALSINESFIPAASLAGINEYQIFFDAELAIVDFVETQGWFVSPGMLIHLLENNFKTQTIVAKGVLNEASIREMISQYDELIVKPSIKMAVDGDRSWPHYAQLHAR